MKCTNKECIHRWYCKKYEMPAEAIWQDRVNLSNECNALNNFQYLEVDEFLKDLHELSKSFIKLFPNIIQEDIDKTVEEISKIGNK